MSELLIQLYSSASAQSVYYYTTLRTACEYIQLQSMSCVCLHTLTFSSIEHLCIVKAQRAVRGIQTLTVVGYFHI